MIDVLAGVVVDFSSYFEFAAEAKLDPDDAVMHLESLAGRLQTLEESDQRLLAAAIRALGEEEEDPSRQQFVSSLPDALGLVNSEEP